MLFSIMKRFTHLRRTQLEKLTSSIIKNIKVQKLTLYQLPTIFSNAFCNDCRQKEDNHNTVSAVMKNWAQRFEQEKVSEPTESIEHIVASVLGIKKAALNAMIDKELNSSQLNQLEELCLCRLSRMPVQYIIGEWDFRHITLKLEPPVFIPRPETETLVDHGLKRVAEFKKSKCKILEIGCGSGAICLSLLHSSNNVDIVAIDQSIQACKVTSENAKNLNCDHRLEVLNATLTKEGNIEINEEFTSKSKIDFKNSKFDIIISNPPYVPTKKMFRLQPEIILYEDVQALDGGDDGLKVINFIIDYASKSLNAGGYILLEVNHDHPLKIEDLILKNYADKFKYLHTHKDAFGTDRIIEIVKKT